MTDAELVGLLLAEARARDEVNRLAWASARRRVDLALVDWKAKRERLRIAVQERLDAPVFGSDNATGTRATIKSVEGLNEDGAR